MPRRALLQVFAYDEPYISDTLDAYAATPVPDGWRLDREVAVTPTDGRTSDAVANHPGFTFREVPSGKLSARNHAHDAAVSAGYDAILTGDADEPPADDDYYAALLAPLDQERVVGVTGFPKSRGVSAYLANPARVADQLLYRPMRGNSSAFTATAWKQAGPFDTSSVDQTEIGAVRAEEERRFRKRLAKMGRVVDAWNANTTGNDRRVACMAQDALNPFREVQTGYCGRRGVETFAPDDRDHRR
jgi:cellulose synthase/poly-beta-1,6-N-acetylglucosamine synthase-like glycosyltransferase